MKTFKTGLMAMMAGVVLGGGLATLAAVNFTRVTISTIPRALSASIK